MKLKGARMPRQSVSIMIAAFLLSISTQGCASDCDPTKSERRCSGTAMEYCKKKALSDGGYWSPFFVDCGDYNAECRDGYNGYYVRGLEQEYTTGVSSPNGGSSLNCVLPDSECDENQPDRCSDDGTMITGCKYHYEEEKWYAVILKTIGENSFCVESSTSGEVSWAYFEGTCENGDSRCDDDCIVHCDGEFWTDRRSCNETCVENSSGASCN